MKNKLTQIGSNSRVRFLIRISLVTMMVIVAVCALAVRPAKAYNWSNQTPGWDPSIYPDVIGDCNQNDDGMRPDACIYHITAHRQYVGSWNRVSPIVSNCKNSSSVTAAFTISGTVGSTYTVTNETQTSIGLFGPMGEMLFAITASVTQSTSQSVSTTTSTLQGITETGIVGPNEDGWYGFAPKMSHSAGWLEVHYPSPNHGHYYWYYPYQGASHVLADNPLTLSNGLADGYLHFFHQQCGHHQ